MCLIVKKKDKKLSLKVIKLLDKYIDYRGQITYTTPYRGTAVPDNGLIIARNKICTVGKGLELHGECVHSVNSLLSNWVKRNKQCEKLPAYAICVIAEGDDRDIGSRALYIPRFDKTKKKNDNRKIAALNRAKTKDDIIKIFPELKDYL